MRSLAAGLSLFFLCACPGGRPRPDAPAAPPAPAPDAPPEAVPAAPAAEPPRPRPWQTGCAEALGAALTEAARLEPALALGRAEVGPTPDGREQVTVDMMPPYQPVNLHVRVERPRREPGGPEPGPWQRSVEILEGRAFFSRSLRTASGEASILLDGWDGPVAEAVASVLEPAVERCLASRE